LPVDGRARAVIDIPYAFDGKIFLLPSRLKKASVSYPLSFNFGSGSVNQLNGSKDLDPYQNVTDPEHCLQVCILSIYLSSIYDSVKQALGSNSMRAKSKRIHGRNTGKKLNFFYLLFSVFAS
jgi:hypothetical protein